MLARHEEYCSAGMAEVVEPDGGQPCPLQERLEVAAERLVPLMVVPVMVRKTSPSSCQREPIPSLSSFWRARWRLRASVALREHLTGPCGQAACTLVGDDDRPGAREAARGHPQGVRVRARRRPAAVVVCPPSACSSSSSTLRARTYSGSRAPGWPRRCRLGTHNGSCYTDREGRREARGSK